MAAMNPARLAAQQALVGRERGRVDLDGGPLSRLEGPERRQAHDLVLGVRRHLFLLDGVLRGFLRTPVRSVPALPLEALRMGAYDLLFNTRVPRAVVVAETVELAGHRRALRGLVNAVLRRIAGSFEIVEGEEADVTRSRHHVWLAPGRAARFSVPVVPDPKKAPERHLAQLYTLTELFVTSFLRELPLESEQLFRACGARLPLALRPRKGTSPDDLRAEVEAAGGVWLRTLGGVAAVHLEGPVGAFSAIREGRAVVQDRVAAEVAPFVGPVPGERVLDLCAPPGGKTAHLWELMEGRGTLVAAHAGPQRRSRLEENLERLGMKGRVTLHDLGPGGDRLPDGPFDRVLVDAPCSNTGVLMKRVDARFRVHDRELGRLEALQLGLLERAASLVRPQGILVHATCSIVPGENHGLVRRFLERQAGWRLEEERLRYPQRTLRDGGYMARLVRER